MKDLVTAAKMLGRSLHCKQVYGEGLDYEYHLAKVEEVLLRFGYNGELIRAAAWLHDSLEDTQMKLSLIEEYFGDKVAELVYAVTNETGINRKERNAKTYPKIKACKGAVVLKLADRIANVEHGLSIKGSSFTEMYKKEYPAFKYFLHVEGECDRMWQYLESLLYGEEKYVN